MTSVRVAASVEPRPDRGSALIAARALSKSYLTKTGEVTALKSLDFEIHEGEFVAVIGQSGCGKSTLLKVLAGILPYTSGSIELNGKPLRGPSSEAAVVFQSPVLLPWRTVLDNVLLPIEFRHLSTSSYRDNALDLLEMVGVRDFAYMFGVPVYATVPSDPFEVHQACVQKRLPGMQSNFRKSIAGLARKMTGVPEQRKSALTSLVSFARFRRPAEDTVASSSS